MSLNGSDSTPGVGGRCSIASGFIATGASATPQSVLDLLKKLDNERMARNAKRAQRRIDGEGNVSADESDEITPVLITASPATGPSQPSGNTAGGSQSNIGGVSVGGASGGGPGGSLTAMQNLNPDLIADDAEAAQNSLDLSEAAIPRAIFTLARSGIAPPLTLFTPDALQRIRSGLGTKSVKVTTELKDSAHLLDISLFPNENEMNQAEWMTSYNSFFKFIDRAYGPATSAGFAKHFEAMISDPEFKDWFTAFRDFDIRIRSQFFTKVFIIDPSGDTYAKLLQSAKNRALMQSRAISSPVSPPVPSAAGPSRSEKTSNRVHPYGGQRKSSFRGNPLCLRCGSSEGHRAADCKETHPNRHGRQFVIYANKEGLFRVGSNVPVCFTYNLAGECRYSGGQHAVHMCSLCAGEHPAIRCTRN
ncbi:hypothetical protein DFH09DRAFT_897425 [Mycena vulgaris]|nr:hypothetical protein DFH09DRAFT_897425 [Mycena vulgaris]